MANLLLLRAGVDGGMLFTNIIIIIIIIIISSSRFGQEI